jgi:hypothetical protein
MLRSITSSTIRTIGNLMDRSPATSPKDDLAFLRTLAEAGRDVPLVCGPYFLVAGCVFALASFAAFGLTLRPAPPVALTGIWLAAGVIYAILVSRLNRRAAVVAGTTATINHAISTVWMGLGWGIAAMFAGSMILAWRFDNALVWAAFPRPCWPSMRQAGRQPPSSRARAGSSW